MRCMNSMIALLPIVLGMAGADCHHKDWECGMDDECTFYRCVCGDGHAHDWGGCVPNTGCLSAAEVCSNMCGPGIALVSSEPTPTVIGSPECTAFCEKHLTYPCGFPAPCYHEYCIVPVGSCENAVRKRLACLMTDSATWSCQSGALELAGCPYQDVCGDAGAD